MANEIDIGVTASVADLPIRVRWCGWESDTYSLKRSAWIVFANTETDLRRNTILATIGLRDPTNSLALFGRMELRRDALFRANGIYDFISKVGVELKEFRVSDKFVVHELSNEFFNSLEGIEPIDGLAYVPVGPDVRNVTELKLFRHIGPKEIYLPSNSVDECLNRILQLQFPEQKLIREAAARPVIQATVFSVAT